MHRFLYAASTRHAPLTPLRSAICGSALWLALSSALGALSACEPAAKIAETDARPDARPDAEITAPADGAVVLEGSTLTLRGQASDVHHEARTLVASWFVNEAEACPASTPTADGTTACGITVPEGAVLSLRLEVVNPDGSTGTARAAFDVTPSETNEPTGINEAPEVLIDHPTSEGVYPFDTPITLRAAVSDAEDTPEDLKVQWVSSLDGELADAMPNRQGIVESVVDLSPGAHEVQAVVTDRGGKQGQHTVLIEVAPPNSAPGCTITAPADGGASEEGAALDLVARVSDPDIGAHLLAVSWSSDKDGPLGTSTPNRTGRAGLSISSLSINAHQIRVTVTDEQGASCTSALEWTVGTPPMIVLERPTTGDRVTEGELLTFTASVSDSEDLPSDLWVTWESSLDGLIYEGPPDSTGRSQFFDGARIPGVHHRVTLRGEHVLTTTVSDSSGLQARTSATFTVNGRPSTPVVKLSPPQPQSDDDLHATITTAAIDPDGDALTYTYAWSRDGKLSSASTSATLPAAATTRGDTWHVVVTASDGAASHAAGPQSVTIRNALPTLASVSVLPHHASEEDLLTCSSAATSDADGDEVSLAYAWYLNGVALDHNHATLDRSRFARGDVVSCSATPSDGRDSGVTRTSDGVTIFNTSPRLTTVSLSPTVVYTNGTLSASAYAIDRDPVSLSYAWFVDGSLVQSGTSDKLSGVSAFDRDQQVYVVVTANDGVDSSHAMSNVVTVQNSAPDAPTVALTFTESSPAEQDGLTCTVTHPSIDADGDPLAYIFDWDVDGTTYTDVEDNLSSSTVSGTAISPNQDWTCEVWAYDGYDSSEISSDTLSTERCDGRDNDGDGLGDEGLTCTYRLVQSDLSSGMLVDDDLYVSLNGVNLYSCTNCYGSGGLVVTFNAKPGDTIDLWAVDSIGGCRAMSNVSLLHVQGGIGRYVSAGYSNTCGHRRSSAAFWSAKYTIPGIF